MAQGQEMQYKAKYRVKLKYFLERFLKAGKQFYWQSVSIRLISTSTHSQERNCNFSQSKVPNLFNSQKCEVVVYNGFFNWCACLTLASLGELICIFFFTNKPGFAHSVLVKATQNQLGTEGMYPTQVKERAQVADHACK